jgi:hypothetical protein
MVHDTGTIVAERITAANWARRKPRRPSPLGSRARKINLAKARGVDRALMEETSASVIKPGSGALVGFVPVRFAVD